METLKSKIRELNPIKHQKKQSLIVFSVLFLMAVVCLTCGFTTRKDITIYIDTNAAGEENPLQEIKVNVLLMTSVEDAIKHAGITLTDDDAVNVALNEKIINVDAIYVTKKVEGILWVDGKNILFKSAGNTVADVLKENKISVDLNDEVTPSKDTILTTATNQIRVVRVDVKMEGRQQEVDYGTDEQENADLSTDTRNVLLEGVKGLETIVENVTYKDGVVAGREVLFHARISNPINEVVEVGTKLPGGGNISTGHATIDPGDEMDFICAVVAQEGGHSYEGALAVISCIMNRADRSGSDAVSVITAPGQFSAYLDGDYEKYMGDALPEVRRAVTDCMENGLRSHDCYSFRGYAVDGAIQIGGNYYF